ncbi:TonB-dependent receptor [Weeksellaceae bacterium TAE3-ERU29]|nr:TonB-dependent receptor [Weeksellaceae bacterium TAE3-ERU29]
MQKILILTMVFVGVVLNAQTKLEGIVKDSNGKPVEGCEVFLANTNYYYLTENDGKYSIDIETPGKYTMKVSAFGFKNTSKELEVTDGNNTSDFVLELPIDGNSVTNLKEIVAEAKINKSDEVSLLNIQRKSVEIVENIGAVQLSKQGVGDIASAVTKATSTVKQQGNSTFSVRGLLDRYNTTTLNGLAIPSNDPENKNIDLALFKTDIVEYIGIEKVFGSTLSGDFGGANINIVSKEFSGKPYLSVSLGSSVNTQTLENKDFYTPANYNYFGFDDTKTPTNSLTTYQSGSWNFQKLNHKPINLSFSLNGGRDFIIGEKKLKAFFYAGFDNDYTYANGLEGNYNAQGTKLSLFDTKKYKYSTNMTGLVNLFFNINNANKLNFTTNYIRSTDQEVKNYLGYHYDWAQNSKGYIRRSLFKSTDLLINQLGGDHTLNDKLSLKWIAGYNTMTSKRPDRVTNTLIFNSLENNYELRRDGGSSNRYFDNLSDNDASANFNFKYKFNEKLNFNAGYQGRFKTRNFESKQYDFRYNDKHADKNTVLNIMDIDNNLNAQNFNQDYFSIRTNFSQKSGELTPMSFDGNQYTNAGYVNADYSFNDKLTAVLGVRVENVNQNISWKTNLIAPDGITETNSNYTKVLPSLNVKYSINNDQNLKVSLSRTYSMPQLKELAYYIYDDISEQSQGNPFLNPSDNNNLDIKWEFFPNRGELISFGVYGKYIQNPISKALVSESLYSYLNVGDHAYVYGVEAEVRKDIYRYSDYKIYAFANGSYLKSKSELNNEKIKANSPFSVNFNDTEDQLEGAADLVGNANLGFNYKLDESNVDFIISYSYVGENLYSIGTQGLGRVVTKPISLLDTTLKYDYNNLSLSLKAKNLLNATIKRVQENMKAESTIYEYKNGTEFGLSIGCKF